MNIQNPKFGPWIHFVYIFWIKNTEPQAWSLEPLCIYLLNDEYKEPQVWSLDPLCIYLLNDEYKDPQVWSLDPLCIYLLNDEYTVKWECLSYIIYKAWILHILGYSVYRQTKQIKSDYYPPPSLLSHYTPPSPHSNPPPSPKL